LSFPFEIQKVITLLYLASREEYLQNPTQIFTFFSLVFSHSIEGR